MKKRRIKRIIIITVLLIVVMIRIDKKAPQLYRNNMSPEAYETLHNVLVKVQIGSKQGIAKASEGINSGKEEYLNVKYGEDRKAFIRPMHQYHITCAYGFRFHPVYFFPEKHRGIDLACDIGTPVYSIYDGKVVVAGEKRRNGLYVKIDHDNGYQSAYVHLDSYKVKEGQRVKKGQLIGKSGNSGTSTGPHLHFALKKGMKSINPQHLIDL